MSTSSSSCGISRLRSALAAGTISQTKTKRFQVNPNKTARIYLVLFARGMTLGRRRGEGIPQSSGRKSKPNGKEIQILTEGNPRKTGRKSKHLSSADRAFSRTCVDPSEFLCLAASGLVAPRRRCPLPVPLGLFVGPFYLRFGVLQSHEASEGPAPFLWSRIASLRDACGVVSARHGGREPQGAETGENPQVHGESPGGEPS
jgi:hypothetical protein